MEKKNLGKGKKMIYPDAIQNFLKVLNSVPDDFSHEYQCSGKLKSLKKLPQSIRRIYPGNSMSHKHLLMLNLQEYT